MRQGKQPFLTDILPSGTIGLSYHGPVAQLGARFNRTEEAGGSNPPRSTGIRLVYEGKHLGP